MSQTQFLKELKQSIRFGQTQALLTKNGRTYLFSQDYQAEVSLKDSNWDLIAKYHPVQIKYWEDGTIQSLTWIFAECQAIMRWSGRTLSITEVCEKEDFDRAQAL